MAVVVQVGAGVGPRLTGVLLCSGRLRGPLRGVAAVLGGVLLLLLLLLLLGGRLVAD